MIRIVLEGGWISRYGPRPNALHALELANQVREGAITLDCGNGKAVDVFDVKKRSEVMARVRSKNTQPELLVRRFLHARGFRFRLHRTDLPGKPDLVFPSLRTVIFVNGCFWHGHEGCRRATIPATRTEFWVNKIKATKVRDVKAVSALEAAGWTVRVVWECSITPDILNALASEMEDRRKGPHLVKRICLSEAPMSGIAIKRNGAG